MVKTALTISMTSRSLPRRSRKFGRRRPFAMAAAAPPATAIGEDFKLFASTWLAGFLFVSLLLA